MKVLVIGSGGREHALTWKISQSPRVTHVYCAPGNAGTGQVAENVALNAADHRAVIAFCQDQDVAFVVVGPEQPLVDGLVDALEVAGIAAFGPSAAAAQLEASKGFTKDLCAEAGIPTAPYRRFMDEADALTYVAGHGLPVVIKADGLASGKGVTIAETRADAEAAVRDAFGGKFGAAGAEVVVEGFLDGEEASLFVLCDGENIRPLATAQDHKRAYDGDTGPNTGGMGAYSPAPVMTDAMTERALETIIWPTVKAMAARGTPFKGVLYAGLMITANGPELIEYNVRFGDPECQVLMVRLAETSDILPALIATTNGTLDQVELEWIDHMALTVVLAAKGYPESPLTGTVIAGLRDTQSIPGRLFHAGTRSDGDISTHDQVRASGGRVLNAVGMGPTLHIARDAAYAIADRVDWPDGFKRRDIGWRSLAREHAGEGVAPVETLADFFPGFESGRFMTGGSGDTEIFYRVGGAGPPILLLHGYPQTHAMWHQLATELARTHTVVLMDLRGYGRSGKPAGDRAGHLDGQAFGNETYSKRSLGDDARALMSHLGFERFRLAGHDRGGRVSYRLALDHPDVVTALVCLDIVPTIDTWEMFDAEVATKSYHWPFLAQPYPMPERLIAADPGYYVDHTIASWTQGRTLAPFHPVALMDYRQNFATYAGRQALCEDYRAGATTDHRYDTADRAAGRTYDGPMLALWGADYVGRKPGESPLDTWRTFCPNVVGEAIDAGHFIVEENPEDTGRALMSFLAGLTS